MKSLSEGPRDWAFLLTEATGSRSRQTVTIRGGDGLLQPGTVLGKVTADSKFCGSPNAVVAGKEGAETASAILAHRVDTADGDVVAVVIDGEAEVKIAFLLFDASVGDAAKVALKHKQLSAVSIKVR